MWRALAIGAFVGSGLLGCAPETTEPESIPLKIVNPAQPRAYEAAHGVPVDYSWTRIAGHVSQANDASAWLNSHPRLSGATYYAPLAGRVTGFAGSSLATPIASTTPDWNLSVTTTIKLNVTAALRATNLNGPADNTYDRVYIYGHDTTGHFIGLLSNATGDSTGTLPAADLTGKGYIDSAIDGSALTLSADTSQVYGVSSGGKIWSFDAGTGALSAGWPSGGFGGDASNPISAVSWSSPWIDYVNNVMFVADQNGAVTAVNLGDPTTSTAPTVNWQDASGLFAYHGTPVYSNGFLWVGDDSGYLHRYDLTGTSPSAKKPSKLCSTCSGSATCGASSSCNTTYDSIWGIPSVDPDNGYLLVGVNNRVIQIKLGTTGNCATTLGDTSCAFTAFTLPGTVVNTRTFFSSIMPDPNGGSVYVAYNKTLYKASYGTSGITGSFTSIGTLANSASGNGGINIHSSPTMYPGSTNLWVGDRQGHMWRYDTSSGSLTKNTPSTSTAIDSIPIIDFLTPASSGNNNDLHVYVSGNSSATAGQWMQLRQNF
jgi:hypothetical protein